MKSYEQLKTEYEDALFALLMDNILQAEGQALLDENEHLKSNSDNIISPEADNRMHAAIEKAYKKKRRQANTAKVRRFFSRSLAAIFIAAVLVSIGCAMNPEVKAKTLMLMTKVTEKATILYASNGEELEDFEPERLIYDITYIPVGFYSYNEFSTDHFYIHEFINDQEAIISVQITHSHGNMISSMDTENADVIENITINGNSGLLVIKGNRVHIETYDVNEMDFIDVVCTNLDRETVIKIAEGIQPINR